MSGTTTVFDPSAPNEAGFALDLYGWLFLASIAALIVRVMIVPSAIMMNDEYYYAKTSYLWLVDPAHTRHITSLPTRGEADFPNALFFAIYRFCYLFGQNFYVGAKLLNVFFASLMAMTVQIVARQFVPRRVGMALAILVLWLPAASYYTYFVPEPLYEFLVWAGLAGYFLSLERNPVRAAGVLGAFLGAAVLAKPNAAAMLVAVNGVVLVVGTLHRRASGAVPHVAGELLVLNVCFVGAAYLLNLAVTGNLVWDPVGKFYQTGLSKIAELDTQSSFLGIFAKYSAVYLLVIAFVLGPALTVVFVRALRGKGTIRETALLAMCVVGISVLLLGSAKVATNWERVYVNHVGIYSSRYMSVLFPLLIIGFARFLDETLDRRTARAVVAVVLAICVICLGIGFSKNGNMFQMREVMWPKDSFRYAYRMSLVCSASVTLYYGLRRRPRIAVYGVALYALALLSCGVLLRKDVVWAAQSGEAGKIADAAKALTAIVPDAEIDRGLVVTTSNQAASRFMFQFPGIDALLVVDSLNKFTNNDVPVGTSWIVFVGEGDPQFAGACVPLKAASFCPLTPNALPNQRRGSALSR